MAIYVLIGFVAFCFMEFVAWSNHKYIMHGFLWNWHKNYHRCDNKKGAVPFKTESKRFEKNDRFFIMYATPAIILLIIGFVFNYPVLVAISFGITAYGLTYFLIHNVIIHERLPLHFLQKHESSYIKAIRKVHLPNHRPKTKKDFHIYELLVFPRKLLKH